MFRTTQLTFGGLRLAAHLFELLRLGLHLLLQGGERVPQLQSLFVLGHHLLLNLPLLACLRAVGVYLEFLSLEKHCLHFIGVTDTQRYSWLEDAFGKTYE